MSESLEFCNEAALPPHPYREIWTCYTPHAVQPGTAITVKEMGPAVATRWAFLLPMQLFV